MSFEVGQTVGGYELLETLDSRTGVAFKARNLIADRFEVLRILPRQMGDDQEQTARFQREIKVHSRLLHPNIVTFYTALAIDGQPVMTTEWVEGMTLATRLERGAVKLGDALNYACQALVALECAHDLGVVHREVCPENMILTPQGVLKLTGFGLAKAASDPELTQAGTIMGWIEYMSPEQVQGVELGPASDVYALGVVLYELITGQVPFLGNSQVEVMLAHAKTPPRPPLERNPRLPAELSSIALTALAKDPEQRFPSAKAFRSVLEEVRAELAKTPEVLESFPGQPSAPEPEPVAEVRVPPPPPAPAAWPLSNLIAVGVGTFILVVLLTVAVLRLFGA
ncbi:MAG: serine/threonine protein kinase [Bryobacterales bacterium]|nr:serine/threonine protein kinase [Bryobacterales bacterium]